MLSQGHVKTYVKVNYFTVLSTILFSKVLHVTSLRISEFLICSNFSGPDGLHCADHHVDDGWEDDDDGDDEPQDLWKSLAEISSTLRIFGKNQKGFHTLFENFRFSWAPINSEGSNRR